MKGTLYAVAVQRWHMQPANFRENNYPAIPDFFLKNVVTGSSLAYAKIMESSPRLTTFSSAIAECDPPPQFPASRLDGLPIMLVSTAPPSTSQDATESALFSPSDFDTAPAIPKLCDVHARS